MFWIRAHFIKIYKQQINAIILIIIDMDEGSRVEFVAAARSVTVKPTGCGFDPHSRR